MSRGIGIAKSWLPGKHHSYVAVRSNEESGELELEFQNEKFKTKRVKLDPKLLIELGRVEKFMGVSSQDNQVINTIFKSMGQ